MPSNPSSKGGDQQQGGGRRRSKDQGAKKNPFPKSSPQLGSSSETSPQQWGEMAANYYTQNPPAASQFNAKEAQKQLNDYWVYANEQCSDPYSAGRVVEHKEPENPPNQLETSVKK
eukprot:TRINITY_DN3280_c0_g1_i11.p1 TRINITY_DN3280_c0_g1~~TRINITY_DN3280_c0_g1_i11.p1  ORF type:complete len:116 (-),score=32.43 TRINITY_DN3280_c0_g1_i11:155-502(-)